MSQKNSKTCYPFLNNQFQLCSFLKDRTPMAYIEHSPSKTKREFTCIHSVATLPIEDAVRFKNSQKLQTKALQSLKMIGEEEYERYGITCETRLQGINSYLEGIATLFNENPNVEVVFDQLVTADQMIGSVDYSLNSEIARFIAQQVPKLETHYQQFLFKKHKIGTPNAFCNGLIADLEKFYSEDDEEEYENEDISEKKNDILLQADCIPCPDEIARKKNLDKLPTKCHQKLKKLDLSWEGLAKFPKLIEKLSKLQVLSLSGNNITHLPEYIDQLSDLRTLNLWKNKLITVPDSIGNLSNLEMLDLGNNRLTRIPSSIGNLPTLTYLNLQLNNLTEIPTSIGNSQKLLRFGIAGNKNLLTFPANICDKLRHGNLFIDDNYQHYCKEDDVQ